MKPAARFRDIQFRLEYVVLRCVIAVVRALPLEVATSASARAWRLLAPRINPKRHNRALANLAIAFPEKSEEERLAICMAHWENLGRVMAETMQIDRIIAEPDRIVITSAAMFGRYRDKLGPAIGISLHMGNWELAIWPLTLANANPAAIYRSVNNPYVDEYLRAQRKDLYTGGLFGRGKVEGDHGDDRKTARVITDYVRKGGRLGMVCDLYDRTGIPVPFFGQPAKTQAIGAMIARRVGARLWLSRCKRIGTSSRFEIELKELRVPRTANQSEDIKWIMTAMQQEFEAWIRESPEQWMWSNRRWS
ncbi:Lipid A biosynthesis acyltransferase [Candidatus Filomicrobium marinum]|uniref:Lipid A biosynthesis acyltransferase n=2 Tax=Filomicrobium TaxID=119044 RepID=A0A0D6JIK6_9HYPH|nr:MULTISPECIES: lipid A biosynthesis acyltransferase [Filomicrobium]MCV0371430.1 lipid A biosynthesis acyltransferase [Filomicrobium sp.]CFX35662.1 Lipid A biosynthesis acyltransferase [Candidatus Filomicrobium marinum]CPR21793.1 Lipid A biosynthesis acyltransferase [Candidatus Filomicrobium marinum]SDP51724.1 KDO2-lipid IV(A) lauroyltransferase [Filomicrobium insigne]